jgi:putative ABC transport system ATP-binding protein
MASSARRCGDRDDGWRDVNVSEGGAVRAGEMSDLALGASPDEHPSGAVAARDVFKIYKRGPSETVALRGASLTIEPGEFVSLEGPSGSGKSSLMAILAGLATPSAGDVVVDGRRLADLDEAGRARWRAARVGIVFQKGNLVPFLSAEENVALIASQRLGRRQARAHAHELLESLGLGARSRHRAMQLSGGEVQRAGIAVRTTRRCSSATSSRASSTRRPRATSWTRSSSDSVSVVSPCCS